MTGSEQTQGEFFPDTDLITYVSAAYGPDMADRLAGMLYEDPESNTGFMRSIRRSLTREMLSKVTVSDV